MSNEKLNTALYEKTSNTDDGVKQQRKNSYPPVYLKSFAYAEEEGEKEKLFASFRANVACKEAIEQAINEKYVDNRLDTPAICDKTIHRFGFERVKLVLATTVRKKYLEKRISPANIEWAQRIPMEASFGSKKEDRAAYYVVNVHPGLLDLLVTQFRQKQAEKNINA